MPKLPIKKFSTLYTNTDSADAPSDLLLKAENARIRDGYVLSEGLELTSFDKPEGEILWFQDVILDEDKLKTKLVNNKIIEDYTQDILRTYFLILRLKVADDNAISGYSYIAKFYLLFDTWTEIVPAFTLPVNLNIKTIVNKNGIYRRFYGR